MTDLHVLILPSWYHFADRPHTGTFFQDQALALKSAGIRVGVAYVEPRSLRRLRLGALAKSHFQVSREVEGGVPTVRCHGWNPLAQTLPGALVWARMTSSLVDRYTRLEGRPDIIHAQASLWAGYAALRSSVRQGVPFIVTEHSSMFQVGSMPSRTLARGLRVFRYAAATIAVSESLRRRLVEYGATSDILVVPNTVDTEFWTLPPKPRSRAPFTFCAIGNLVPTKAFDLLIRAFASRFRDQTEVHLVFVGGGVLRQDLESLAQSLRVRAQVEFLGALPREGVRQVMWGANGLVLPSRSETFGVVLIEALATGLPVISTRCGGPEDIVTPEVGMLLEPGDEQGLGDALAAMLEGPRYDEEMLRANAVRRYGYAAVGARLRDVYQRALGVL